MSDFDKHLSDEENAIVPTAGAMAEKRPVVASRKQLAIKSTREFEVNPMGLEIKSMPNESAWEAYGTELFAVDTALPFYIGDWMNAGNFEWGAYKRFAAKHGGSWRTIENYAYVCRNVHLSLRNERLTYTHHLIVAALFDEDNPDATRKLQTAALKQAFESGIPTDDFRVMVQQITAKIAPSGQTALPSSNNSDAIEGVVTEIEIHKPPVWKAPIDRLEKDFTRRWQSMDTDNRTAALKRLKDLVKMLERLK